MLKVGSSQKEDTQRSDINLLALPLYCDPLNTPVQDRCMVAATNSAKPGDWNIASARELPHTDVFYKWRGHYWHWPEIQQPNKSQAPSELQELPTCIFPAHFNCKVPYLLVNKKSSSHVILQLAWALDTYRLKWQMIICSNLIATLSSIR